jgi:hypothetical protein
MVILRSPKGWTAPREVDGHHLAQGLKVRMTPHWREMDSNFQYASTVTLVCAATSSSIIGSPPMFPFWLRSGGANNSKLGLLLGQGRRRQAL